MGSELGGKLRECVPGLLRPQFLKFFEFLDTLNSMESLKR